MPNNIFHVLTFCSNGGTRLFKWNPKIDKHKRIVKLVNSKDVWDHTEGLGEFKGQIPEPRWPKMVQNGTKWSVKAQYDPEWLK
jgi:hypothetical protein